MTDRTIQVAAYLPEPLYDKLKAVASADDRSISYAVIQAVREMIGKPENVEKWAIKPMEIKRMDTKRKGTKT